MVKRTRKQSAPQRARGVPHQIYLSADESRAFKHKAAARGCSLSDLVRHWINLQPRKRKSAAISGESPDPRQTNITDAIPPEGQALREWAERNGKMHLLT